MQRADLRLCAIRHSEDHLSEELQASYEELQVLAAQLEEANTDLEQRIEQRTHQLAESEARYRTLFAASPVPFMVLAPNPPDFTITAANDAYLAATPDDP